MDVKELRNKASELLGKARAAYEQEEPDIKAGDALMVEFQTADKAADEAEGKAADLKAALDKYDAPPTHDTRDPNDASFKGVKPEDAKAGVMIKAQDGSGFSVVPYASEGQEGWIKGYPVAVQHPEIIRRLTPEMALEADAQKQAFWRYCRFGKGSLDNDQRKHLAALDVKGLSKALQEGTDSEGGYLVPSDAVRLPPIVARGTPGGRVRPICSQFNTTRDGGDWPTTTDDVTWTAIAEEAAGAESNPTFGQVTFTIRKFGRTNKVSEELLGDSAVDIASLLGGAFTRGLGRFEDEQAIGGDGSTEPLGLRTTGAGQGDISDVLLASATAIVGADLLKVLAGLPAQWRDNATWLTGSQVYYNLIGAIGITAAGAHLIENLRDAVRPTLIGLPVVMTDVTGWDANDGTAIAANEEIGCLGDFSQYYFITRVGMVVRRLDELYAGNDQVGFRARTRFDSFFAENDAFRIIKAAAS